MCWSSTAYLGPPTLCEIESRVASAGATIRILNLAVETATPSGRLTFHLFASIAQFERENMLER